MKMAVWQIMGEYKIKLGRRINEPYLRVAFKPLEDTGQQAHFLNLPKKFKNFDEWNKYLVPGTVLDVSLQGNKKNVNYFMPFKVIKEVDGVTYERSVEE